VAEGEIRTAGQMRRTQPLMQHAFAELRGAQMRKRIVER
jgi:hypothetical protein